MKKSIYNNPYKYAYQCDAPIELAKAVCKLYRKRDKWRHIAAKCPECGHRGLYYVNGSYEEGYGDFISCDCCGMEFDTDEIKNSELLHGFSDFDIILFYSCNSTKEANELMREEELGISTIDEWHKWAWQQLRRI